MRQPIWTLAGLLLSGALLAAPNCQVSPGFEQINTAVKGFPVPRTAPVSGVEYLGPEQFKTILPNSDSYRFIDTRPDYFYANCRINGSENFEYTFSGPGGEQKYVSRDRLTTKLLQDSFDQGQTVVLFCNNAFGKKGCWRAANAAITAVCDWQLPADKIKWFGDGVPGLHKAFPDLTEGPNCRFDRPPKRLP